MMSTGDSAQVVVGPVERAWPPPPPPPPPPPAPTPPHTGIELT